MTPLHVFGHESIGAKPCAEASEVGEFALLSTRGVQMFLLAAAYCKWLGDFELDKRIIAVACVLSLPASTSHTCCM